jgi:hypothetical protein
MLLRSFLPLASVLALSVSPSWAQVPTPAPAKPADPPAASPTPPPATQSPADRLEELKRELARLQVEIQYVKERAASASQLLRSKFAERAFQVRAIDAGQSAAASVFNANVAPITTPQRARPFSDVESKSLHADVIMTVDGSTVTQAELDQLIAYLGTMPSPGDRPAMQQRATLELIRIHALMAAFPDTAKEARNNIATAREELGKGQDFDEVLKRYGTGPNMAQGGKVQITRYCPYGLAVEAAAFSGKEGEITQPVTGLTGMVLLHLGKRMAQEGSQDTGPSETIDARMIQVPYNLDQAAVDKQRGRAALGQVEIAVRNDEIMAMLPAMYRANPVNAKPAGDVVKDEPLQPEQKPKTGGDKDGKKG